MRIARWSAVAGAAVLMAIPVAAEASTGTITTQTSSTNTSAPSAPTAPTAPTSTKTSAPSTSTNTSSTSTAPKTSTTNTSTKSTTTSGTTTTQTTPAPGGTAEAYALKLSSILAISHTKANAGPGSASSTADPLELGGSNPPSSQFGGNGGNTTGALFDTGTQGVPANQFRLAITPWSNKNTVTPEGTTSSAMAQILYLSLGDPSTSQSLNLSVLQSKSDASWTPTASSGDSSSDGAILNAGGGASNGGLTVDLLHADASSSGKQSSYLLSINGNEIGSSSQVNGACVINIPSLLSLSCVTASGGVAGTVASDAAEVAHATVLPNTPAQQTGDLFNTNVTANSGGAPQVSSSNGGQTGNGGAGNGNGNGNGAAKASSGALAFTGMDVGGLVGLALALGLGGVGLVWWSRRNRMSII